MRVKREALRTAPRYMRLKPSKGSTPTVDRAGGVHKQGLIRGASLVTRGEALGHGLWLDSEFVASVQHELTDDQSVKSRFTHPSMSSDGLATHLGRAMNGRLKGDQAFADFHFTASSHKTPDGDLSSYVMDMAEESPADVAISIVYQPDWEAEKRHFLEHGGKITEDEYGFEIWDNTDFESPDPDNTLNLPHARLAELCAADFVGDPAANPGGLFGRESKFLEEAESLAEFALGLSSKRPQAVALGLDAVRVRQFVNRFMHHHQLEVRPMRKHDQDPNPTATDPAATPAPADEPQAGDPAAMPAAADEPTAEPAAAPAPEALSAVRAEMKRFRTAFGEKGPVYFDDGLSFEEATARHVKELTESNAALAKENGELKKKLGLASQAAGEQSPVGFEPTEGPKRNGFASKIRIAGSRAS